MGTTLSDAEAQALIRAGQWVELSGDRIWDLVARGLAIISLTDQGMDVRLPGHAALAKENTHG